MSGFVYLIRNKDLYKIGTAQNIDIAITKLRPTELLATLKTNKYDQVKERLHSQYSAVRLPESEYFRLTKNQADECKQILIESEQLDGFGPLQGFNMILFLLWWVGLSGIICWFLIRPLLGGELF